MSYCIKLHLVILATFLLMGSPFSAMRAGDSQSPPITGSLRTTLPDGLYLVLREANSRKGLEPTARDERVVVNDYHFLEPAERGEPEYLTVSTKAFIPIILSSEPIKEKDDRGRPKLMLELARNQIRPLERFTRVYCNRTIAIVIGGQVVTAHRIREPITAGRMQITRCTDNGCDVLHSILQERARAKSPLQDGHLRPKP